MELSARNFQDIPVSTFTGVSLIIIFSLYLTSAIKSIPCGKNMLSNFVGNFVHTEASHLIVNLYALYALSSVEQQLGAKKFFSLLTFLVIFNTLIETGFQSINKDVPCSIGFSGVLFGVMTWEIVSNKGIDFYIITSIGALVLLPSLNDSKASLSGHAIGAFSGIIGGLIWNKLITKTKNI